jgi:hypothetical protein
MLGGGYELYKNHEVGALVGAGAFVGGCVTVRIGGALPRPGLPEADARNLAARYDRSLGQHLGISAGASF